MLNYFGYDTTYTFTQDYDLILVVYYYSGWAHSYGSISGSAKLIYYYNDDGGSIIKLYSNVKTGDNATLETNSSNYGAQSYIFALK